MNDLNDHKTEEVIRDALARFDSGESPAEILRLFPEHQTMLTEVFSTISLLEKERTSVMPSKELFKQVLAHASDSVTDQADSRYLSEEEVTVGRPSLSSNITTKIDDLMTMNWKVWVPIGVVAIVALVFVGSSQFGTGIPGAPVSVTPSADTVGETAGDTTQTPTAGGGNKQPAPAKPATGNVDDAVDAILAGIADDQALFADAEADASLVVADSQAINDFGQSYNGNEF